MKQGKIGVGTISLVLLLSAVAWGFQWDDGGNISGIGVFVLKSIGLGHLVLRVPNMLYLFACTFTIPAFIIGRKYNEHWGAKTGWILSAVYISLCLLLVLLYFIFR